MQNDNKIFCYLLSFKNSVHHVVDISEKNGSAFGEGGVGGVGKRCDGDEDQSGEGEDWQREEGLEIGIRIQ